MRRTTLVACAWLATLSFANVSAEEPRNERGIFESSGFAKFRLQSGRLMLDPIQYRKGSHQRRDDDRSESIVVSCVGGVPSLHYTSEDAYQRIQMVAEHGKSLRIESTLITTGEIGVLTQIVGEPIHWETRRRVGSPELDQEVDGKTLLHIVGQDESGFRVHLESLVTRMLRGRSLVQVTLQTHRYLCENVSDLPSVSIQEIESVIEDLKHPSVGRRRDASRKLAAWGSVATPLLAGALERDDLDAEQRARVTQLIQRSTRYEDDTVASLAFLLSTDRHHWTIVARRLDQQEWLAANHHIRRCGLPQLTR